MLYYTIYRENLSFAVLNHMVKLKGLCLFWLGKMYWLHVLHQCNPGLNAFHIGGWRVKHAKATSLFHVHAHVELQKWELWEMFGLGKFLVALHRQWGRGRMLFLVHLLWKKVVWHMFWKRMGYDSGYWMNVSWADEHVKRLSMDYDWWWIYVLQACSHNMKMFSDIKEVFVLKCDQAEMFLHAVGLLHVAIYIIFIGTTEISYSLQGGTVVWHVTRWAVTRQYARLAQ